MPLGLHSLRPRRWRHGGGWVAALAFSADGRRLAVALVRDLHPVVSVLDAGTGRALREFPVLDSIDVPGWHIAWSPDGARAAWWLRGSSPQPVLVSEVETGFMRTITTRAGIETLHFVDSRRLLVEADDGVALHGPAREEPLWRRPAARLVGEIDAGSVLLAEDSGDRLVRVAVETGEILEEVPCPHTVVHVLRVLRDGRHVLCLPAGPVTISGGISEVRLAPTESQRIAVAIARHACPRVTFSPDEALVACCMVQRALIWETRSGRLVEDLPGIGDGPAAFSPDGTLATGSRERDLLLWPLRERLALRGDPVAPSEEQVRARAFAIWQARGRIGASALHDWLRAERDLEEARHAGPISLARFSRDGTRVLSAHEFSALRTWDAASHDLLAVVPMRPGRVLEVDAGLSSALLAGAWPDHAGHLALVDSAAADPPFRRWQAPGREDYRHDLAAAALTDDGASVFLAVRYVHVDSYDGDVFLSFWCWEPVPGRARELHLQAPGFPSDPVLAPSPGGGDLLLAGPGGWARGRLVQIFSVTDGHCWWQAHVGRDAAPTFVPFEAAWNAQGSAFAVTMDHQLFLGERAHPGELRQLAGHEAGGLTWSVCGRFLGVAGRGRARVGEVSSGRTVFDQAFDGRIMALWIPAGGGRLKVVREEGPPFVPIVSEHSF